MGAEAEHLLDSAMNLPYAERFALAERLNESLHPPGENLTREAWWEAWAPEIRRRLAESDAGVPGFATDEVFAELRARRDDPAAG